MSKREDPLVQFCATPMQGIGTVLSVDEASDTCSVEMPQGPLCARRALSCLLAPQAGDRIWFAGDLAQGIYVTAVLERASAGPQRICLPPDSRIEASQGSLTLSAESLRFEAVQLSVRADDAAMSVRKLVGVGREATWSFGSIKVISDLFESFAERVVQFSRWSQRTVDGMDQVRSRQIDYRADQSMQLQAENLIANAGNLVKFDGEQIHLG